jgi:hypothetical protein
MRQKAQLTRRWSSPLSRLPRTLLAGSWLQHALSLQGGGPVPMANRRCTGSLPGSDARFLGAWARARR